MKEKWRQWKQQLFKGGKNQWLIFLLAGLILLVMSIPSGREEALKETEQPLKVVAETDKASVLGEKLEAVLRQVQGVGKVKVLVTLKSDGKRLVEKDSSIRTSSSGSTGGDGENTSSQENAQEESTIFQKEQDGRELPYVSEQMEPEVAGVLVVAEGGGNPVTAADITEAVQALFGIEAHKIKVMKMN